MTHHHHPPAALAGAIIAHYLRNLTIAQGKRWTPANDRDMARLTQIDYDREMAFIATRENLVRAMVTGRKRPL